MDKVKILFLTSDPSDSARLRLGQELRDIRENLQLSKQRDKFLLESRESVRPKDITQAIFDIEPHIVHFSGHGMSAGELCFEDILGKTQPVQPNALANLFELVAKQVGCVILNACYSEIQAKAIVKHIPFVVGMNQAIGDRAAITFASGFYKALGAGRSFEDAYKFARVEIQLEGISEDLTPVLHKQEDSIDIEDKLNRAKYVMILSTTVDEVNKPLVEAIVAHLRQISGDTSLTLQRIEAGSLKLFLEGSDDGFKRLEELFKTEELVEVMEITIQDIKLEQEKPSVSRDLAQQILIEWKSRLATDIPEQSPETCDSIAYWLLGKDPSGFDDLTLAQRRIAEQAMDYRYRILRQRYLGISPEQAYRQLIQRLSSLVLIRNKIRTWIALSHDRKRTVTDVLQEVIQELLQSDAYMQQRIRWITECTNNSRLRNSLLLASIEEYCLRPIRNQPLLVYRFVNYLSRSQKEGITSVSAEAFTQLVSEEVIPNDPDDASTIINLINAQVIAYQNVQDGEEVPEFFTTVQRQFEAYLIENVDPQAAEWLRLYLQGRSQESIAQVLGKSVKEVYRLREKVNYHAIRVFTSQPQPEPVISLESFLIPSG